MCASPAAPSTLPACDAASTVLSWIFAYFIAIAMGLMMYCACRNNSPRLGLVTGVLIDIVLWYVFGEGILANAKDVDIGCINCLHDPNCSS
jgi:hypothetical protein